MKISLEILETLLVTLLLRCEELKLLLQNVETEIAILKRLILEMKQAEADKQVAERKQSSSELTDIPPMTTEAPPMTTETSPSKRVKKVIEALDVRPFLHRAAQFWDVLNRRFHIHIKYIWFCQFICLRYSLKRQRGGIPGSDLSPTTVLSYFKRERAGII